MLIVKILKAILWPIALLAQTLRIALVAFVFFLFFVAWVITCICAEDKS